MRWDVDAINFGGTEIKNPHGAIRQAGTPFLSALGSGLNASTWALHALLFGVDHS